MPSSIALRPEIVVADLGGHTRDELFAEAAARLAAAGLVGDPELVGRRLLEREQLGATVLPGGVAIPHCRLEGLKAPVILVTRCPAEMDFGASPTEPVTLLFFVVSPTENPALHLQTLAQVARWAQRPERLAAGAGALDPALFRPIFES